MRIADPSRFHTEGCPNRWSHEALRIIALESCSRRFSRGPVAGCDQSLDAQSLALLRQSSRPKPLLVHLQRSEGIKRRASLQRASCTRDQGTLGREVAVRGIREARRKF
jgi:hypothetical protein